VSRRRRARGYESEEFKFLIEVFRTEYEVTFTTYSHLFSAHVAGDSVSAHTVEGLIERIKVLARKSRVRVEVPCTEIDQEEYKQKIGGRAGRSLWRNGIGVRHFVITGRHSGTGAILIRFEDGETGQLRRHHFRNEPTYVRRLNAKEIEEYKRLRAALDRAKEGWEQWFEGKEIDPDDALKAAIAEKVDTPDESDAADD
jgi:hypothetical protein